MIDCPTGAFARRHSTPCGRGNQVTKLTINSSKTKVMAITRHPVNYVIRIDGRSLDQVSRFVNLGATFKQKWDCDVELKIPVGQAKTTFLKLKNLMLAGTLLMALRLRVVKCYVWPILLYGAETWSIETIVKKNYSHLNIEILICSTFKFQLNRLNSQPKNHYRMCSFYNDSLMILFSINSY